MYKVRVTFDGYAEYPIDAPNEDQAIEQVLDKIDNNKIKPNIDGELVNTEISAIERS